MKKKTKTSINIKSYEDIKTIRSYFAYKGVHHHEISDFNTAINHLENDIYELMELVYHLKGKRLNQIKKALIYLNKIKGLDVVPFKSGFLEKVSEEIKFQESSLESQIEFRKRFLKRGKTPLPESTRIWILRLMEASKKEYHSYEPFRIYMSHAVKNDFNYKEKMKHISMYLSHHYADVSKYYYIPNIRPTKQERTDWVRSMKQKLRFKLQKDHDQILKKSRAQEIYETQKRIREYGLGLNYDTV